jgi:hypothetical protein
MKTKLFIFWVIVVNFIYAIEITAQVNGGVIYTRMIDATGWNTESYQNVLTSTANALLDSLPSTIRDSFAVYDFSFYIYNDVTSGYPTPFQRMINIIKNKTPYYLVFGKQNDLNGIYSKFWVDINLPQTGQLSCIDDLSPSYRSEIIQDVSFVTNEFYNQKNNCHTDYADAEIVGMRRLGEILGDLSKCCNSPSKGVVVCHNYLLPAKLVSVEYFGGEDTYLELKQEDNNNNFGLAYPKPHFDASRVQSLPQSPVAIVGGSLISATLVFQGDDIFEKITAKGTGIISTSAGNTEFNFWSNNWSQNITTKIITVTVSGKVPSGVVFLENFKILWSVKTKKANNKENGWVLAGESTNDFYITLRKPYAPDTGAGYDFFRTLIHIGCTIGSGHTDIELQSSLLTYFSGKVVTKYKSTEPLKYYKDWVLPENYSTVTTKSLIKYGRGQCNAWTKFFLDILKSQGIQNDGNLLVISPKIQIESSIQSSGFLVGDWEFTRYENTFIINDYFKYWNIIEFDALGKKYTFNSQLGTWEYVWRKDTKIPLPQIKIIQPLSAQGNPNNSLAVFSQHLIVQINIDEKIIYFDPSYGITYASINEIDENIGGYWIENPQKNVNEISNTMFSPPIQTATVNVIMVAQNDEYQNLTINTSTTY